MLRTQKSHSNKSRKLPSSRQRSINRRHFSSGGLYNRRSAPSSFDPSGTKPSLSSTPTKRSSIHKTFNDDHDIPFESTPAKPKVNNTFQDSFSDKSSSRHTPSSSSSSSPSFFDKQRESRPYNNSQKTTKPSFFQKPRDEYFHHDGDNEDDSITYRTKQEVLFSTPPETAPNSAWKNLRDKKAPNKYISAHLPVPIIGEAIYGTHAVYSAIASGKRTLHNLYILSSALDHAKKAARPDSFHDVDIHKNNPLTKKQKRQIASGVRIFDDQSDVDDDNNDSDVPDFMTSSTSDLGNAIFQDITDDEFTTVPFRQTNTKHKSQSSPHHINYSREPLFQIYELAKAAGIRITPLRRDKLDILSADKPHNGVILDASAIAPSKQQYLTQEQITPLVHSSQTDPSTSQPPQHRPTIYLAMDSFFDPNNVGAVLRSASFFGIDGVIVPHNSCPLSAAAAKVASGALDAIPIIQCNTLSQFLQQTLQSDIAQLPEPRAINRSGIPQFGKVCVVGLGLTQSPNNVSGTDIFDFLRPIDGADTSEHKIEPFSIILIAGNESAGLSKELSDLCHLIYSIPNRGHFPTKFRQQTLRPLVDSLNVSNAVAIALSEVLTSRQAIVKSS